MHGINGTELCLFFRPFVVGCVFVIIIAATGNAHGSEVRTSLQSEVVRDVINYEDEESTLFVRGKFNENIYDKFYFNFSLLRDINKDRYDYTWNLNLKEIEDHFDFTAGNYNLNFGSGLIMGKKGYRSSDPFSRSITMTMDDLIIPASGSNPAYTFFGTAANIFTGDDDFSAGIVPFYSLQRRYGDTEDISRGYVGSSLSTLSLKTDKTGNNRCSADIINSGACLYFTMLDLFKLQFSYFKTVLQDSSGRRLQWEYDAESGSGIYSAVMSGMYIGYDDEYISLFIEPAYSVMEYDTKVTGRGINWGAGIKNRAMILSLKGKNCSRDFHSEYTSGNRNPENIFEIKTGIIPSEYFEAGFLVYNEKNLKPAGGRDYIDGMLREEIFTGLKPVEWIDVNVILARVKSYRNDLREEKTKFSSSAVVKATDRFFIRVKSDIQQELSAESYVTAMELKYLFFDYYHFVAGYTEVRVAEGGSIYASVIPASDAEMCSAVYKETAHAGALKFRYQKENFAFHIRGELISGGEGKEMTVESSLGFTF